MKYYDSTCSAIGVHLVNRACNHRILQQNLQPIVMTYTGIILCRILYIGMWTLSNDLET